MIMHRISIQFRFIYFFFFWKKKNHVLSLEHITGMPEEIASSRDNKKKSEKQVTNHLNNHKHIVSSIWMHKCGHIKLIF